MNDLDNTEPMTRSWDSSALRLYPSVCGVGGCLWGRTEGFRAFEPHGCSCIAETPIGSEGIAEHLGVSRRKVDQLSRLLDNFERFVAPEDGESLQRRIEFMLWAQPMTRSRLKQVLPRWDDIEIETALANLQSAGRVTLRDGAFRITTPERRLVRDDWLARVGGLTHQLASVSSAAVGRFFNDDDRAFARTVS